MSTPLDLFINLYLQEIEPYKQPDGIYFFTKENIQQLAEKAYLEGERHAPPRSPRARKRSPEQRLEDERRWDLEQRRDKIDVIASQLARTPYVFKQGFKVREPSVNILTDIPMGFPHLFKLAAEYLDTLEAFVK